MKTSTHFIALIFALLNFVAQTPVHGNASVDHEFTYSSAAIADACDATSTYCSTPSGLYTANITSSSATLIWSEVWGAWDYHVQIRMLPYGNWYYAPGSPTTGTSITVNNLSPSTSYEWRVQTYCEYGDYSGWSWPVSFTTSGYSACYPPSWLNTYNITQTTATFEWSQVTGAMGYTVEYRVAGGYWQTLVTNWSYAWINVTGLQPATTYEWRVKSNCGYGQWSGWSSVQTFTTLGSVCQTPWGLYTTNITQWGATLHWEEVWGASSYSVQIRLPWGSWYSVQGSPFTSTWATVSNLDPGTTYEWRVKANCGYGEYSNWSYPSSFTTLGQVSCNAPSWLNTINITSTTATLSWSSVSGAMSYTVELRTPGGYWQTIVTSWSYTSLNIAGLTPGGTYEWRVRSNCTYGSYSPWSTIAVFTTSNGYYCYPPESPYTTNITQTGATFNWWPVSGATSYTVQIRVWGGSWVNVYGSPTTNSWISVNNLDPGVTYEWRVRTNCGYGNKGSWSAPVTFTTNQGNYYCTVPENLYTSNISFTSATWSWAPVSGAWSYTVQWRYPGGNWYTLSGGPWTNTTLNVSGLQPGTVYEWRVKSNCSYGNYSDWSWAATFTTLGGSCIAPSGLITTDIGDNSAAVHWSPVSGAQSYSVQYRLPNGVWTYVTGSPFTDTTVTINNLSPGTSYAWRVKSNCGSQYSSGWSVIEEFTTTGMSACSAPDTTYTTNLTETHAKLNWSAVAGALDYTIQWRVAGGAWQTLPIGPWPYLYLNFSGLQPGTTYEWRVRSNCSNGLVSAWSEIASFTTLGSSGLTNDNCSQAVSLTVGNDCTYTAATNVGATPSLPAPQGNCPSVGYKDVWFKFTMPSVSYPNVTIRTSAGTLTDAVMEVYIGTNCSSLAYLVCENDNTNGNGSLMPVINVVGGAGVTVWVRVWGNNGATGTFDICVLDHQSDDFTGIANTIHIPAEVERTIDAETPLVETAFGISKTDLLVTPNPARDQLKITYQQSENSSVTALALSDMSGKTVWTRNYTVAGLREFDETLDVSGYTPGMYLLQVVTTTGVLTEKVFIVD